MVRLFNCGLVIIVEKFLTNFFESLFPARKNKLIPKADRDVDLRVEHRCSLNKLLSLTKMKFLIDIVTRFSDSFAVVIKTGKVLVTWV